MKDAIKIIILIGVWVGIVGSICCWIMDNVYTAITVFLLSLGLTLGVPLAAALCFYMLGFLHVGIDEPDTAGDTLPPLTECDRRDVLKAPPTVSKDSLLPPPSPKAQSDDNGWISIKDRMPKEGDKVLFVINLPATEKSVGIGYVKITETDRDGNNYVSCHTVFSSYPISHWQYVPELPESLKGV